MTSNLSEGLNFYNSLAAMLTEFKSGCQDWSRARKIDVQGLVQRFAGTSLELRDRSWEQPGSNGAAAAAAAAASPSVASPRSASTTPRRSTRSTAGKTSTPSASNRGGSKPSAQKAASNGNDDAADAREEEEALRLALGDDAGASDQTPQQQSQHQGQRQWGQWGGGAIQFGD